MRETGLTNGRTRTRVRLKSFLLAREVVMLEDKRPGNGYFSGLKKDRTIQKVHPVDG